MGVWWGFRSYSNIVYYGSNNLSRTSYLYVHFHPWHFGNFWLNSFWWTGTLEPKRLLLAIFGDKTWQLEISTQPATLSARNGNLQWIEVFVGKWMIFDSHMLPCLITKGKPSQSWFNGLVAKLQETIDFPIQCVLFQHFSLNQSIDRCFLLRPSSHRPFRQRLLRSTCITSWRITMRCSPSGKNPSKCRLTAFWECRLLQQCHKALANLWMVFTTQKLLLMVYTTKKLQRTTHYWWFMMVYTTKKL